MPRRVIQPLQTFLEAEIGSGVLLLVALAVALAWSNAPFRQTYDGFWGLPFNARLGRWSVTEDLRGWVRDGLMTLFFLVVGLEIKREMRTGELRNPRALVLPLAAALGGMVVPALVFLAFSGGGPGRAGWGVAMPTDIAIALGILALAAPRCPSSLRVLLLSLAIADDLGTIVVVAVFYSHHIAFDSIATAAALGVVLFILERRGMRSRVLYAAAGIGMWTALHGSGVSPTLAGVALGLLTPAIPRQRPAHVSGEAHRVADETVDDPHPPDADAGQWLTLARLSREAVSPLARLEQVVHPWTSYAIVPLFVLAEAGVSFAQHALTSGAADRVVIWLVVARVLGKPVGILGAGWLVTRTRLVSLPSDVSGRQLVGAAAAAGAPFSVSLFVGELAFGATPLLDAVRVAVAVAAVLAGVLAFAILRGAPSPDAITGS